MFELLRKMILPVIIVVLVLFTATIFYNWGYGGGNGQASANVAGVINGEEISWPVYQRSYAQLYQSESRQNEDEVTDARVRELEELAWNQILQDRLLMQEARKAGLVVSDEDVFLYLRTSPPSYLQSAPVFQTDGRFDYSKYVSYMADPQAAPMWQSIEPQVRSELMKLKLQQLVLENAHVSEAEVKQAFLDATETVTIDAVILRWGNLRQTIAQATEDELASHFEAHSAEYTVPNRVVLNLVRVGKQASDNDWENARLLANDLYDSAQAGTDFGELAKTWSDDAVSAKDGGDLGWFAAGRMVREFDSASFAMKEGEISPPIKTVFGWHLIKHLGYRTDQEVPRGQTEETSVKKAHVQQILCAAEASQETLSEAWSKLDQFRSSLSEGSFTEMAEAYELEVLSTEQLDINDVIKPLGGGREVLAWALKGKASDVSAVTEDEFYYTVVEITEFIPAGPADFEDVKDKVTIDIFQARAAQTARDSITAVYAEIQGGATFEAAAQKYNFKVSTLPGFSRDKKMSQFSSDAKATGAAFALTEPGQYSGLVEFSAGATLMRLKERTSPELTTYNAQRDSIQLAVSSTKQQDLYVRWFQKLIADADIVSNVGAVQDAL